jgi:PBSX family phage portal protein
MQVNTAKQRKVVAAEEESDSKEYVIEASLGTVVTTTVPNDKDVFAKSAKDIKALEGTTAAFKRKADREMKKILRGTEGAETKRTEDEEATGYSLFEVAMPPYNLEYLADLYEISSPHMAAVEAKVYNIVGLGYDFVESEKAKSKLETITEQGRLDSARRKLTRGKQELNDWLDSCNEEDEFVETLIKAWTDYESTGNGYIEIGRVATGPNNGLIRYIGHIPSRTMRVRKNRDGFVQIISNKAVFFRNYGDKRTSDSINGDSNPNEIIHLKNYTPKNSYYGVPDIISAMPAVTGNDFSSRFNLDYFENKAVPRYVIIVKGGSLSNRAEQNILEFFQTSIKGKNHRTLFVPLPAEEDGRKVDFKMEAVEAGTQDSSFNTYRKGNLVEILMSEGVPMTKVSLGEGVSLAAARDADKTFKEQKCRPKQAILEKKLNKLVKEITDAHTLRLNELSLTDEDTQSKIDERYLRMQTIVPNEVRARKGMPAMKGGDKPVDLKPQQASEAKAQAGATRTRDAERSAASPDKSGEGRATQGEGRQVG